jgi:hypothetical protein
MRKLLPHGTVAAYQREHILRGQPPCEACAEALRAYTRRRNAYLRSRAARQSRRWPPSQ